MAMNELLMPFDKMLETIVTSAAVRVVERGGSGEDMWLKLCESGFLDALMHEDNGGAGLSLGDLEPLIEAVGAHAVPLPVAETMAARALLARARIAVPQGPIAMATSTALSQIVSCGMVAKHVLIDTGAVLTLVDIADLSSEPTSVHQALATRLTWGGTPPGQSFVRPAHGLRPLAAVLRSALIAGAAGRLTMMTAAYANERVQFGKPIGRQQALQQNLAVMAEDMIAARIAAQLGCAHGIDVPLAAAATAKATTSAVAARIAATAHAVHGAIGISEEYDLQLLTRRLHEWRLTDGSESYWHAILGAARLADPATSVDWIQAAVFA
jgi:acyl-CoA dehydrogenase